MFRFLFVFAFLCCAIAGATYAVTDQLPPVIEAAELEPTPDPQPVPPPETLRLDVRAKDTIEEHSMCVIFVDTNARDIQVKVKPSLFETVQVLPLATRGSYVFTGPPADYWVWVQVFDPELGIADFEGKVSIVSKDPTPVPPTPTPTPPGPGPDPPPTPDVPTDEMGNLAQRVAAWALEAKLTKTKEVGEVYATAGARLSGKSQPILLTIDAAGRYIAEENGKLGLDQAAWQPWVDHVKAEWTKQVTDRTTAARFYELVSIGLKSV